MRALAAAVFAPILALAAPAWADGGPVCGQTQPDDPSKPYDKLLLGDADGVRTALGQYGLSLDVTETDEAFSDGVAESFTLTSTLHLAGLGTAPDLRAHTTNHLAIVNGELMAFVSNISFDCA